MPWLSPVHFDHSTSVHNDMLGTFFSFSCLPFRQRKEQFYTFQNVARKQQVAHVNQASTVSLRKTNPESIFCCISLTFDSQAT